MRVVLLRPPRYVWPFNSETSAFWQPLGLCCLASAAREGRPGLRIDIWDCPGERIGWRTLARRIAADRIDVLGLGEETVSAHEAIRAARLVREHWPECLVAAGGVYFPYAGEGALADGTIDVIVRGEGERTFPALLDAANNRARWSAIPGLAFRGRAGAIRHTPPAELIDDLDNLPFPAYDLLAMDAYGRGSRNHPRLVSIEHSRGCVDSCSFCILWKHMGRSVDGNGHVRPCYRTKSPARSLAEVLRLAGEFGRRTFGWVDPTFNADPAWSAGFAHGVLASPLVDARGRARTLHTAWLRADGVVRDERLGILEPMVRAGLRQVMIGVERTDPAGLDYLGKHDNGRDVCREAFAIFRERYPQVYTIGTLLFGLPGDGPDELARLVDEQYELGMDYCFLMPLTPLPGTAVAADTDRAGRPVTGDLSRYNFHTPVMGTGLLSARQLEQLYRRVTFRLSRRRLAAWRRQLTARDRRKRRVFAALTGRGLAIALRTMAHAILRPDDPSATLHARRPSWYDK